MEEKFVHGSKQQACIAKSGLGCDIHVSFVIGLCIPCSLVFDVILTCWLLDKTYL